MKKIVCFLVLTIITTGYPQVPDFAVRRPGPSYAMPSKQADSHETGTPYFVYGGVHFMGGVPMGGAGIRLRKETHCLDFSGYTCLLYFPRAVSVFHLRGLCLFYPNQQGFYLGAGFGLLNEPETTGISGSVEGAIGVQWKKKFFLEANAVAPFFTSIFPVWPGLTMGIGF